MTDSLHPDFRRFLRPLVLLPAFGLGLSFQLAAAPRTQFNSYFIQDGSFLRIRNVTLRYNIPVGWAKKGGLESASIYSSVQNLFTFTKYVGYNPEANNYGNSTNPTYGVDQGSYPMNRTITLGLQAGF